MKKLVSVLMALIMVFAMGTIAFAETTVTDEAGLIAAFASGGTVVLDDNITVTSTLGVPAGVTVTLDLNGKTVSMETADDSVSSLIYNHGNLTVMDSGENGKLSYNYTGTNSGDAYNTIESAPGSVLTIESGIVENLSTCLIAYAIDGLTNGNIGDVTVNVKGGTITSEKQAIRIFANSTTKTGTLNISGGTIFGRVIIQNANTNANKAVLNITNGTFNANEYKTDVLYVGGSNSATIDIDASVSGGNFNGEITDTHVTGFIYGGTFTDSDAANYMAYENEDGEDLVFDSTTGEVRPYEDASISSDLDGKEFKLFKLGYFTVYVEMNDDEEVVGYLELDDTENLIRLEQKVNGVWEEIEEFTFEGVTEDTEFELRAIYSKEGEYTFTAGVGALVPGSTAPDYDTIDGSFEVEFKVTTLPNNRPSSKPEEEPKAEDEQNPNTGAPVFAPAIILVSAAAAFFKKR